MAGDNSTIDATNNTKNKLKNKIKTILNTVILSLDIIILLVCAIEDLMSMHVELVWLYIFILISLIVVAIKHTYNNVLFAVLVCILLKLLPTYSFGDGDIIVFAGLTLQFGILPTIILLALSLFIADLIPIRSIPFVPIILIVFLIIQHYVKLHIFKTKL